MVYEATSKNIDELLQTDYAVVDFYGDHCGACVALAPVYNEAANDLAMIRFIKANVDKDRELGERFNVRILPTLLCFRNGELIHEDGGAKDMPMLHEMLSRLLYCEVIKMGKIRLNENAEVVRTVREGLKETGGYCPCRREQKEEYKCICQEFRAQCADPDFEGYCHCMLYYKEK